MPTLPVHPVDLVQRQLDAYNAHDLDAFMACYAEDVRIYRLPALEAAIDGKAQMRAFYASHRFNVPGLRAEVVNRMAFGNKVIDHEHIHGLHEEVQQVAVVFEVVDGLIRTMWSHSSH